MRDFTGTLQGFSNHFLDYKHFITPNGTGLVNRTVKHTSVIERVVDDNADEDVKQFHGEHLSRILEFKEHDLFVYKSGKIESRSTAFGQVHGTSSIGAGGAVYGRTSWRSDVTMRQVLKYHPDSPTEPQSDIVFYVSEKTEEEDNKELKDQELPLSYRAALFEDLYRPKIMFTDFGTFYSFMENPNFEKILFMEQVIGGDFEINDPWWLNYTIYKLSLCFSRGIGHDNALAMNGFKDDLIMAAASFEFKRVCFRIVVNSFWTKLTAYGNPSLLKEGVYKTHISSTNEHLAVCVPMNI